MKKRANKLKNKRPFMMAIAVMAALYILFSQSMHYKFSYKQETAEQASANKDQSNNSKEEAEFYIVVYEAIVPLVHLHVDLELVFIFDIQYSQEIEREVDIEVPLYISGYFKTLFGLIIAPNAP